MFLQNLHTLKSLNLHATLKPFLYSQASEKFATLLVEKKITADVHLEPLWGKCGLCYLDIDVIGKMETFEMDSNYIVTKVGMNESMLHLDEHLNVSSGGSTDNLAKSFFAKLSQKFILELYEFYKLDFKFFDYDYKNFL